MRELTFDSGVVSYSLNGKCEVSFNPADRAFAERFYNAVEEMQKVLDGLFDAPVCAAVFGDMSLCAFANGFPVWLNLMLAILDEIEANIGDIQKQADPRIAKYKAKYQKYSARYHK